VLGPSVSVHTHFDPSKRRTRCSSRRTGKKSNVPALTSRRRTSTTTTFALLESFGASFAEIRQVHEADGLRFEEVFGCVGGGGEAAGCGSFGWVCHFRVGFGGGDMGKVERRGED
jgi:hypothetical protein